MDLQSQNNRLRLVIRTIAGMLGSDSIQDPAGLASGVFLSSVAGQFAGIYRLEPSFLDREAASVTGPRPMTLLGSAGDRGRSFAEAWTTLASEFAGRDALLADAIRANVPAVLRPPQPHVNGHRAERYLFENSLLSHEVISRLWAVYPFEQEPGAFLVVLVLRLGAARPFDDADQWAISVLLADLMPHVAEALHSRPTPPLADVGGHRERYNGLGPRQRELLPMLMSGLSEQEIGDRIFRSRHTIHDHAKRIYTQLGVRSRVELVLKYARIAEV